MSVRRQWLVQTTDSVVRVRSRVGTRGEPRRFVREAQSSVQAVGRPDRRHDPGHPLADENGDVWASPVDENAEMVEMLEASRQYQNMVEALSTAKQLMLETMRMK